ncbi:MAG: hypothetical protein WDO14_17610 [Bacteroidota bacterium]
MKGITSILFAVVLLACQEPEAVSEFTGNEMSYALVAGSEYDVSGTISFKERVDGFSTVEIALKGTDGTATHPVHVHLGTIATDGAAVAALLSPVIASTGKSETLFTKLADDTPIMYKDIVNLEACIKVHLSDQGAGRDVILAGGNIGAAYVEGLSGGRQAFSVCKSN